MATVQDADLHRLKRVDMIREGDADLFQGRAASGEVVLQHPLPKGFAGHRHRIGAQPEGRRHGAFARAGGRGDAVDHAIGKGDMGQHPIGKIGIRQPRQPRHGIAGDMAVAGQVVAGHHGKGHSPGSAARAQGGKDRTKGRGRAIRAGGIGGNLGMGRVKPARGGIDEIPPFRHGQRDDANLGPGHGGDQGGIIRLDRQKADHAADAARAVA